MKFIIARLEDDVPIVDHIDARDVEQARKIIAHRGLGEEIIGQEFTIPLGEILGADASRCRGSEAIQRCEELGKRLESLRTAFIILGGGVLLKVVSDIALSIMSKQ